MLGVQARADGRCEIADYGFGDAVEADGHGGAAQAVLRDADGHTEQQSGGGISAAQPEINGDEQRQIEDRQAVKIDWHESLQEKDDDQRDQNRTRTKLVNLNVRFRSAEFVGFVHWLAAETLGLPVAARLAEDLLAGGFAASAGGAGDLVSAPEAASGESCFRMSGWSVVSTITSSKRSRFAAGCTRMTLKGLPGLMSTTVPTGKSRGKIRSSPLVTTRWPISTWSSLATYFISRRGSPRPATGPWMRDSANIAPTPLSLSVSSNTCEMAGKVSITFPTMPSGVITPMFFRTPSCSPRSI